MSSLANQAQQSDKHVALRPNLALAVIEYTKAQQDLKAGDTHDALRLVTQAAQHDPSAAFAAGPDGLRQFMQAVQARRVMQVQQEAQEQARELAKHPGFYQTLRVLMFGFFVLIVVGLMVAVARWAIV